MLRFFMTFHKPAAYAVVAYYIGYVGKNPPASFNLGGKEEVHTPADQLSSSSSSSFMHTFPSLLLRELLVLGFSFRE